MKNFDEWNGKKKLINNTESNRLYSAREIWWCSFGINIGTEQDGKGELFLRPVLILKGFNRDACLVAPLTTSTKENIYRIDAGVVDEEKAKVNISQMKVVDTKRLVEKVGFLEKEVFEKIKKSIKDLF